jgi:predicted small metal-binding protein
MAKKFKCAAIGMNCGYEETANTTEQLMPKIAAHAKAAHGMSQIPKEVLAEVQAAMKEI